MVSMLRCDVAEGELASSELAKEARLSAKLFALYLIDSMAFDRCLCIMYVEKARTSVEEGRMAALQ